MTEEAVRREGVRRDDREHDRKHWIYPLTIVFICMFLSVAVSIIYTTMAVRQSDQTWCEIVTSIDDAYKAHPPPASNPGAVAFAAQMHRQRYKLHCK